MSSSKYTEEDLNKYTKGELEREANGETGFSVDLVYDCPHEDANIGSLTVQQCSKAFESACTHCTETSENWLCLKCGAVCCSRYKNAHMALHNKENGHELAVSLADLSVWCYKCYSYIHTNRVRDIVAVLSNIKFGTLKPKEVGTSRPRPQGSTSHSTEEEIQEHFDAPEKLKQDAKTVANMIKSSKHVVVYTGAGISTSANIPDYRGPQGVWTLRDKGLATQGIDIEQAFPTYGHYAIKALCDKGLVKYVVSTNVDGLHRRSGVPAEKIAELHGNCYREVCSNCKKEYLRGFDVTKTVKNFRNHITGRLCDCKGNLKDTIIHFSENLPEKELEDAIDHATNSDLSLVLGTSMRVSPACKLPTMNPACKLVIVNLQTTPYDKKSAVRSFSKTDEFLKLVMEELGMSNFDQTHDALANLKKE